LSALGNGKQWVILVDTRQQFLLLIVIEGKEEAT
jgi:hypothetical protein